MCRLFGFRSVIQSQVHRSLLNAENALGTLSQEHPDGWGVAYYVEGVPHVRRSPTTAIHCQLFQRVSGVVASETVLAHVRRATQGIVSVLNCHPFQYGKWIFGHNGDVTNFPQHRDQMLQEISPELRRHILGDTDSEVLFFMIMTELARTGSLNKARTPSEIEHAIRVVSRFVREHCDLPEEKSELTFLITDGLMMLGVQGGVELFYSTHKARCSDRDTCKSLATECETPVTAGHVNHLVFSSQPVKAENVWQEMQVGEVIAVDQHMQLYRSHLDKPALKLASGSS